MNVLDLLGMYSFFVAPSNAQSTGKGIYGRENRTYERCSEVAKLHAFIGVTRFKAFWAELLYIRDVS